MCLILTKFSVMKKDIKKRLEKALTVLQEPKGSTVPAIVKIINKDSPKLSLRKVIEALQEGINEGFLCMYNGRFKLRQQLPEANSSEDVLRLGDRENRGRKISESDSDDDDYSEQDSEDGRTPFFCENHTTPIDKKPSEMSYENPGKNSKKSKLSSNDKCALTEKKTRFFVTHKSKTNVRPKRNIKHEKELEETDNSTLGHNSKNVPEHQSSRCTVENTDLKKQRGPRCTSMKKDIKMPSKVQIPFAPSVVPQKTNIYNDLLRRSPEPLKGPLFDNYKVKTENIEFFSNSY